MPTAPTGRLRVSNHGCGLLTRGICGNQRDFAKNAAKICANITQSAIFLWRALLGESDMPLSPVAWSFKRAQDHPIAAIEIGKDTDIVQTCIAEKLSHGRALGRTDLDQQPAFGA